jgi:hypothetical protein
MATLSTRTQASYTPLAQAGFGSSGGLKSSNPADTIRPYLIMGGKGRTAPAGKTTFQALPRECEDARITGATRSLDRRLLGLNLRGSKYTHQDLVGIHIA